ncbi:MAG: glycosyltransferase N-terminal domain-containing protein [Bacteroidota bacterium]
MAVIYWVALQCYGLGIRLASLFSAKAKDWVQGRRRWKSHLRQAVKHLPQERIWIHCASLGEFEQGRPVIELLRKHYPQQAIVLSFYSPSGYHIRKDYDQVDHVCYLPLDSPANAQAFVDILQPSLALFVKYELWYGYLRALHRAAIPTYLFSAIFHPKHVFFKWYGGLFRQMLRWMTLILVQTEPSKVLLRQIGIERVVVTGDTRIDRVFQLAQAADPITVVDQFKAGAPLLVIGSCWPEDEALLYDLFHHSLPAHWKVVMAPHDISERHIQQIEQQLPLPNVRYSQANEDTLAQSRVLLIDNIGLLSRIYQYGTIAYIGGGFGAGIHNTLEPLSFGLPVIIGPKYDRFEEAVQLVEAGGVFAIRDTASLQQVFEALLLPENYQRASATAAQFIRSNSGASARTLEHIKPTLVDG